VLNLNLSNLLLLLVLKAVVFGAGYIGQHGYKGRELEDGNFSKFNICYSKILSNDCTDKN